MSGHNKWSSIKHKKGAADKKRGKLFSRLNKEIMIAARMGGGDANANPRLRAAVATAKSANMPKDNIERAIKKGTGELEGETYEEIVYEAYAPGGVAIIIEAMTDNSNRTTPEIRHMLEKNGGNMGTPGSASFLFERKGYFSIEKSATTEDQLMELVLEAGAEDLQTDNSESFEVYSLPENFETIRQALENAGIPVEEAKLGMFPSTTVSIEDAAKSRQVLRLMELLDDHEDVQEVWTNFDIPDELLD